MFPLGGGCWLNFTHPPYGSKGIANSTFTQLFRRRSERPSVPSKLGVTKVFKGFSSAEAGWKREESCRRVNQMENPIWFALLQDSSLFQRANISYIILMLLRRAGWICEESCMTLNQMGNPGNHIFPMWTEGGGCWAGVPPRGRVLAEFHPSTQRFHRHSQFND